MNVTEKLEILTQSAKFDVSCSSSGVKNNRRAGTIGSTPTSGICHSFSSDGRCISLLKVLLTNACIYDCQYCVNRRSNPVRRATFTPEEIADLTIDFYKRNYIEGLFLSSSIIKNADYTCELMIRALSLLRNQYGFRGYIHAKAIPGVDPVLLDRLAFLADRLSADIELPSEQSLQLLAPEKTSQSVLSPMKQIKLRQEEWTLNKQRNYQATYAPAGQSTQMIIGATPETDYQILKTSSALYEKYKLKRVFYSAYIPVTENKLLPALTTEPPLLREHRLYQADWLMRFYQFRADEILSVEKPNFNLYLDPKSNWAVQNYERFPIDVQTASYDQLLRIPGIGPRSAKRIVQVRQNHQLSSVDLAKLGVVMKRAQYFIVCQDVRNTAQVDPFRLVASLISAKEYQKLTALNTQSPYEQLSFFDTEFLSKQKESELGVMG